MDNNSRLGDLLGKWRQSIPLWTKIMYAILAFMVLLNFIILPHHPHFSAEKIPGFWGLFSLAGAIVLVKVCKGAAHSFLGKPEDYYDRN